MRKDSPRHFSRVRLVFLLCLPLLLICGCAAEQQEGIFLFQPEKNSYTQALQATMPDYEIKALKDGVFWYLETGAVTEGIDPQARSALESRVAEYWYPQFLSTAIIAIDRDQTDVEIRGWRDLAHLSEEVSFFQGSYNISANSLLCAMSYGLEGENYTFGSATRLLEALKNKGQLKFDSFTSPILICFDDQVARLLQEGRNMEIIVPAEGTFVYQKGLISPGPLTFAENTEQVLLDTGLRLLDGRCTETLYPKAEAYASAKEITDYDHFLTLSLDTDRDMRRDVRHTRLYTGADGREHQILALVYIVIIVFWTASVIRRSIQKSVQRGALAACLILLAWITVRLVKYQTNSLIFWDRFLWFSYLGFQLLLMFTLLVMAWRIDQPEKRPTPKGLWALGAVNLILAFLVLTNDWHSLVYIIDFSNPFWRDDYDYAAGYHLITVLYMAEFAAANLILLLKSIRNPNKKVLLFPLALCVLIVVYRYGYIMRIPLMRESDLTMMTGIFVLLFFEAAIRAGMIPINSKYTQVFTHSPLRMQILDSDGAVALAAASASPLDKRSLDHVLSGSPQPLLQDENILLYGSTLTGGYTVWQEDISGLNRLQRETEESVRRLKAANALLAEEEKVKRSLSEEAAKLQLMERLEGEIAEKTERLTQMIDTLDRAADQTLATARIALLLCYIKRRCNLFFRERETENLSADELTMYIDELAEFGRHAQVNVAAVSQLTGNLPVRQATLFYDFFYEITDWAAENDSPSMLRHLGREDSTLTLRLMPSADVRTYRMSQGLRTAIEMTGGTVSLKDLDDTTGISLSFPEPQPGPQGSAKTQEGGAADD